MSVADVRVLGTGLKEREYAHFLEIVKPGTHFSFDIAVQIPNEKGIIKLMPLRNTIYPGYNHKYYELLGKKDHGTLTF